jgi:hypothetical protein
MLPHLPAYADSALSVSFFADEYNGDPRFDQIFKELNRRETLVFIPNYSTAGTATLNFSGPYPDNNPAMGVR